MTPTPEPIEPWVVALVQLRGRPRLHALALRCHDICPDGRLWPLERPPAAVLEPTDELQWRPDDDLAPCKPCTDVVVIGSAWAPGRRPVRRLLARVGVPELGVSAAMLVVGDRRLHAHGREVTMGEPEPFERMPLDWRRAYGGPSPLVAASSTPSGRHRTPTPPGSTPSPSDDDVVADLLRQRAARHGHPRNPVGCGWDGGVRARGTALDTRASSGPLPNFEDPDHLLDVGCFAGTRSWPEQPMPRGFGWLAPTWFPRAPRFGPHDAVRRRPVTADPGPAARDHIDANAAFAWSSGAAPGLALPWLRGGETLHMLGLSPHGRTLVRLPTPTATRARWAGLELETRWRIHTVCIDVDAARLTVVWRAEMQLPSALHRALEAAELQSPGLLDAGALELAADFT